MCRILQMVTLCSSTKTLIKIPKSQLVCITTHMMNTHGLAICQTDSCPIKWSSLLLKTALLFKKFWYIQSISESIPILQIRFCAISEIVGARVVRSTNKTATKSMFNIAKVIQKRDFIENVKYRHWKGVEVRHIEMYDVVDAHCCRKMLAMNTFYIYLKYEAENDSCNIILWNVIQMSPLSIRIVVRSNFSIFFLYRNACLCIAHLFNVRPCLSFSFSF